MQQINDAADLLELMRAQDIRAVALGDDGSMVVIKGDSKMATAVSLVLEGKAAIVPSDLVQPQYWLHTGD